MAIDMRPRLDEVHDDPWAIVPRPSRPPVPVGGRVAGAIAIGTLGPVWALLGQRWWVGAAMVLVVGAVVEALLWATRRSPVAQVAGVVALAVLAPLATWSTVGRGPAAFAVAGVVVADAALVGCAPAWRRRGGGDVAVASLAVAPLVGAGVLWGRGQHRVAAVVALLVAAGLVELYQRRPAGCARADARARRAVLALATGLGAVLLGLTVAITLYLPGAFGGILERRRRRRPPQWTERTAPLAAERRDALRPFAPGAPAAVARRNLVGVLAVVAAVGLLAVVVEDRRSTPPTSGIEVAAPSDAVGAGGLDLDAGEEQLALMALARDTKLSSLAAYDGVAFADAMQSEQQQLRDENLVAADVGGRRVEDFEGRYVNVTDGERASAPPPPCPTCEEATVWFVGGSAAFGFGQRDDHTVASALVQLAAAEGWSLTMRNFAVPGLTVHEEAEVVRARLDAGEPPPDVVIFYDGYNDTSATLMSSIVDGVDPARDDHLDFDQWAMVLEGGRDPNLAGSPTEMGELVADKYRRVVRSASEELDAVGAEALFVYQPDAIATAHQYDAATPLWKLPERFRAFMDATSDVASDRLAPDVLDLRNLFDAQPEPVFFDLMHLNEPGGRWVAEAILPSLVERLESGS